MTPTYSFLVLSGELQKTLTLSTNSPYDEGTYPVQLTVTLQDNPAVTITKSFSVTISCQVFSLVFNPGIPISQIVQIGIDVNPFVIPSFSVTRVPACLSPPSFTIAPTLGFVS